MSAALGDSCLEMDPSAPAIYDPGRLFPRARWLVPLSSLLAVSLIFAFKLLYLSLKFIINL
jgi:hypothetical protein